MALSKVKFMALKALSYADINVRKNYKVVRKVIKLTHPNNIHPFYRAWNHTVNYDGYEIPVRIFALDEKKRPILLFFHGGGFVTGSIDSYNRVCANMARQTSHTVISVDYRLAPEHPYPTAPKDCYYVAKELFLHVEELFGVGREDITLIGDSAGGNLAAVVSLMARDFKEFMPKKQILIYPVVNNDYTEESKFASVRENGKNYLLTAKRMLDYMELYKSSEEDAKEPYFAPILAKNLDQQPKTLVITAEFDPLRDEGEAYAKKLEEFGNDVTLHRIPDALHGFFTLSPKKKEVEVCYQWINQFLSKESLNEEDEQ